MRRAPRSASLGGGLPVTELSAARRVHRQSSGDIVADHIRRRALKWLVIAMGLVLLVVTATSVYFVLRGREILAISILCLLMIALRRAWEMLLWIATKVD